MWVSRRPVLQKRVGKLSGRERKEVKQKKRQGTIILGSGDKTLVERSHWIPKIHEYIEKGRIGFW